MRKNSGEKDKNPRRKLNLLLILRHWLMCVSGWREVNSHQLLWIRKYYIYCIAKNNFILSSANGSGGTIAQADVINLFKQFSLLIWFMGDDRTVEETGKWTRQIKRLLNVTQTISWDYYWYPPCTQSLCYCIVAICVCSNTIYDLYDSRESSDWLLGGSKLLDINGVVLVHMRQAWSNLFNRIQSCDYHRCSIIYFYSYYREFQIFQAAFHLTVSDWRWERKHRS